MRPLPSVIGMVGLERCTPIPFSKGLGGAIAGRPIAIRYVDNRTRR